MLQAADQQTDPLTALGVYTAAQEATGALVELPAQCGSLPILRGSDGRVVLLYQFVEALDGLTDYDELQRIFPLLSYGQIAGALAFLRKLAQFNTRGLDLDVLEDELVEGDPAFQAEVVAALADRGVTRVLTDEQPAGR